MKTRIFWLAAMALLAALFLTSAVFAEGEVAPEPEEPPTVDAPAPGEPAPEEAAAPPEATQEAAQASQADEGGDPYWYVGPQMFASIFTADTCPPGTSEMAGTCFKSSTPINTALTQIDGGLLPTDKKLWIVGGTPYGESVYINSGTFTIARQLNGFIGSGAQPVINGDIELANMTGGFTLEYFVLNGGFSLQSSSGTILLEDLKITNPDGSGILVGAFGASHVGSVTINNVDSSDNDQIGAEVYIANGNLKVTSSAFDYNDDGTPVWVESFNVYGGLAVNVVNGTVTLDGVSASHNDGAGAIIMHHDKTLIIKNSLFSNNAHEKGLWIEGYLFAPELIDTVIASFNDETNIFIESDGPVTISNVIASDSVNGSGMVIYNYWSPLPVKVSNGVFTSNGMTGSTGNGLRIDSLGTITLTSIMSYTNRENGIELDNCLYDAGAGTCKGIGSVTITSPAAAGVTAANSIAKNGLWGIDIASKGSVLLTNVRSSGNDAGGITIDNSFGIGNIIINRNISQWTNAIDDNQTGGIYLRTNGNITLTGTSASRNGGYGFNSDDTARNVSITTGVFNENAYDGLYIKSRGTVTLTNVSASDNDDNRTDTAYYSGAMIKNTYGIGNVIVKSATAGGELEFSRNSLNGLSIDTNGTIAVSNVMAYYNGSEGIKLFNDLAATPKTVALIRSETNGNAEAGILISTLGNVILDSVSAYANDEDGADIYACKYDGSGGCTNLASVTIRGTENEFAYNELDGLRVEAKGAILLTNVSAYSNARDGAVLFNNFNGSTSGIIISATGTNWASFSDNGSEDHNWGGLGVFTNGTIALTRVYASRNNHFGAYLNNMGAASLKGLTLTDCIFEGNQNTGLHALINGPITARGIQGSYNSQRIGTIDEDAGGQTIYEVVVPYEYSEGYFDQWWVDGEAGDNFTITLESNDFDAYLMVRDEYGSPLFMDNSSGGGTNAQITFSLAVDMRFSIQACGIDDPLFINCVGVGSYVLTVNDPSHLNTVEYYYNGVHLDNSTTSGAVSVTSTPTTFSEFNLNSYYGLFIEAKGLVTLSNLSAIDNGAIGLDVETQNNVSLSNNHPTRISEFSDNYNHGVYIQTTGTITLNNRIKASENGKSGIWLYNGSAAAPKTITITKVMANDNLNYGLQVVSTGAISLNYVNTYGNKDNGARIVNNIGAPANVTINNSSFNNGAAFGLEVYTSGIAILNNVLSEYNEYNGMLFESKGLQIRNSTVRYNGVDGVRAVSEGAVLFYNLKSFYNGNQGDYDGVNVETTDAWNITFQNCSLLGNWGNGIEATTDAGWVNLINTSYFGNDLDNDGDLNWVQN